MADRIAADIVAAEKAVLDPAIRGDRTALEQWLAPDFTEIGQSGCLWTRDEIISDLLTTDQSVYAAAVLTETRVRELGENCYLLTSIVTVGNRCSRRSSIWRLRDGQWQMAFNQGTPLPGAS